VREILLTLGEAAFRLRTGANPQPSAGHWSTAKRIGTGAPSFAGAAQ